MIERRQEAIGALTGVEPGFRIRSADRQVAGDRHVGVGLTRGAGAHVAVGGREPELEATLLDDLAGAPAARQIIFRRRRAGCAQAVGRGDHILPGAVFLGIAVTRIDLDQRKRRGPLLGMQRLVERGAGRRVEAPTGAVRDEQRIEFLLLEPRHQFAGRRGLFETIGRQRRGRHIGIAVWHRLHVLDERVEVHVDAGIGGIPQRDAGGQSACRGAQHLRGDARRRDRPGRDLVVLQILENHVLVAVVFRRRAPDLGPFEADERDEIGVVLVAGFRLALADRLLGAPPAQRRHGFGVIGDRPEVETGAIAREIAGAGDRMITGAAGDRQCPLEGVRRPGRVHVKIAKQDLFGGLGHEHALRGRACSNDRLGQAVAMNNAGVALPAPPALARAIKHDAKGDGQHRQHTQRAFQPSHRAPLATAICAVVTCAANNAGIASCPSSPRNASASMTLVRPSSIAPFTLASGACAIRMLRRRKLHLQSDRHRGY